MADAGFDPQARIDDLERVLAKETSKLDKEEQLPEFLSTHPSVSLQMQMQRIVRVKI